MTQPPRDRQLLVSERPVRSAPYRSERGRERVYARRRMMTVSIVLLLICGGIYAIFGHRSHNISDIPTIKAEANYKQKPADPGGIDIPHQDVEVYDQLEGKNTPQQQVEHLLPPPETPKDLPHNAAPVPVPQAPVTDSEPVTPPVVTPPPVVVSHADPILGQGTSKTIVTTVAPAPVPAPASVAVAPATVTPPTPPQPVATGAPQSIDDVLKDTLTPTPTSPPSSVSSSNSSGTVSIQLASTPDQAAGQSMMENLQQKYASDLGTASLRLVRADLGSRGVFYRIQSQGLSQDDANQICSALKQKKAGCILVRK